VPTGDGPRLLRDRTAVSAAHRQAADVLHLSPTLWGPPALYAQGRWPNARFSFVRDRLLREALTSTQAWVLALRHARTDQRLSLRRVALLARVPPNTLSEVELGARWPTLPTLLRLGGVLGVSITPVTVELPERERATASDPGKFGRPA
jgi:hypothetical protein